MSKSAPQAKATDCTKNSSLSWLKKNVSAERLSTFGLGHTVPLLLEPRNLEELCEVFDYLKDTSQNQEPCAWRVLGAGSNVILPEQKLELPIIRLGGAFCSTSICEDRSFTETELRSIQLNTNTPGLDSLRADDTSKREGRLNLLSFAGSPMMSLSRKTVNLGLKGLAFAAGIPGTVGGGVAMNAGAHGSSIDTCIKRVYLTDEQGKTFTLEHQELEFSYRHAKIPASSVVVAAQLELVWDDVEAVQQERNRCLSYRKETQPLHLPSAGSVFRNPNTERAAAEMLDSLGLKGLSRGGVAFSEMHANWLVRMGDEEGRGEDARHAAELIEMARAKVLEEFGVLLEPEIQVW